MIANYAHKCTIVSCSTWKIIRFFKALTWSDLIEDPKGKYNLPRKNDHKLL
jgi:hypothetical protein